MRHANEQGAKWPEPLLQKGVVDEDLAMASGGTISIVGALKGAVQGAKNGSNAVRGQGFVARVKFGLKGAKLGMKGGLNQ